MRRRRLLIFRRPWLLFSLIKVMALGLYGVILHASRIAMADPTNGRHKVLLFAGITYLLIAVIVSISMLVVRGAQWRFPTKGIVFAALAGVVSAMGAVGLLLAFGAQGTPVVVMSIFFAGVPIINAVVSMVIDTPQPGGLRWQFIVGIQLAIAGSCMVTIYRPGM